MDDNTIYALTIVSNNADLVLLCEVLCSGAKAGTNIQHSHTRFQLELTGNEFHFVNLSLLQVIVTLNVSPKRTGIVHAKQILCEQNSSLVTSTHLSSNIKEYKSLPRL